MENGELKMENVVFWKRRVPFLSLRTCGNLPLVKQSRRGELPAMTGGSLAMTGGVVIANPKGEAIQTEKALTLDCFASLAMTRGVARDDGGLARNDGGRCHCEPAAICRW
jgi:hypothetical protein